VNQLLLCRLGERFKPNAILSIVYRNEHKHLSCYIQAVLDCIENRLATTRRRGELAGAGPTGRRNQNFSPSYPCPSPAWGKSLPKALQSLECQEVRLISFIGRSTRNHLSYEDSAIKKFGNQIQYLYGVVSSNRGYCRDPKGRRR
jgi:hypothetical protein